MITPELTDYLDKLLKWGKRHITLLRFIDLSFTVYGMHRGAQDDLDSHAMRMNNRIIRASTRLGEFEQDEMSDYYSGKIIPTDKALDCLGISMPEEIEVDGCPYVRGVNGYILKGYADYNDVKRGLYMLSIPSSFVFRVNLTEFAHIYKERGDHGNAHPELKSAVESMENQLEAATAGYANRELLMAIPN